METEKASYPKFYPELCETVYAPKWYYPKHVKSDHYSYLLFLEAKESDKSDYFWSSLKETIDELNDKKILENLDLLTIIPASEIATYSPTLVSLGKKLSEYILVPFKIILKRVKAGKKSGKTFSHDERYEMIKDSMQVSEEIPEKIVLILDDVKTTGMTILEAKKILLEKGAKQIIVVCLGINSNYDREK